MPNVNVYRGSDATIQLSPNAAQSAREGELAEEVLEIYNLSPIGRATGVEVFVRTDLEAFHQIGARMPAQLKPGNVWISGKIDRAYINGALLRSLMGDAVTTAHDVPFAQPAFIMHLFLNDPAQTASTNLVLYDVMFENWSFSLPEDDFVMESVTFQAIAIGVEEVEGDG